jgi:UDP-N-acetylmuramoylalanine--D-glutamate ligase
MELVGELDGVFFYDDSKGTNVGAVVAALDRFPHPVVLIAGGRDKGGSYEPLAQVMKQAGRGAVLIGEAAPKLRDALAPVVPVEIAASMEAAVAQAATMARSGDAVLLSPACASFDMFRNYQHRAEVFRSAVKNLIAQRHGGRRGLQEDSR